MENIKISIDEVHELGKACLEANGCDDANSQAVAATMAAAEADGCPSHGLFRLPGYVASLRSGKVDGHAVPTVERSTSGIVRVDGHGGYAPLALQYGCPALVQAAKASGLAALAVVNVHHFSALWVEIESIVKHELVVFAFTSYLPSVAPAGSTQPFFGTNPMAFGWPRGDRPPFVFDQASAAMARGEIMISARDGHQVPMGVGLDRHGEPTTDPNAIINGGTQLPFGGYKGSAIALMVDLLAGGLIGQAFSYEAALQDNKDGGPPRGGELLLAIDPNQFGDADGWCSHSNNFFDELVRLEGVRLPGSRRHANRERIAKEGTSIPRVLHEKILLLTRGE